MAKPKILISAVLIISAFSKNPLILFLFVLVSFLIDYRKSKFGILKYLPYLLLFSAASYFITHKYSAAESVFLMFLRTVLLYNAFLLLAENINYNLFRKKLEKFAGEKLSASLALSMNILPVMKRTFLQSYASFYLRGNARKISVKKYVRFFQSVMMQGLHIADKIAENMTIADTTLHPAVFIITGGTHTGKTTFAGVLAKEFKENGWAVSGIISPGVMKNGERFSIEIVNAATGEKRFLASSENTVSDVSLTIGGLNFSKSGFEYAKKCLLGYTKGCIVFLDEIGPIEMSGNGYDEELKILLRSDISSLFLVIRENLVNDVVKKFGIKDSRIISRDSTRGSNHFFPYQIQSAGI